MELSEILKKCDHTLLRVGCTAEEIRALGGPEDVSLAVDAMPGCCYIDEEKETRGEHGFMLDRPEARTLLWLKGPGIRRGTEIKEADLVDVAPTLAWALGLSLPDAEGRPLAEAFL